MANSETAARPAGRKRLSKGMLIRLVIFGPLFGYFGWQAGARALAEREAADAAFRKDVATWLESPPGMPGMVELIHVGPNTEHDAMIAPPPPEPLPAEAPTEPLPAEAPPSQPPPSEPPPSEPPPSEPPPSNAPDVAVEPTNPTTSGAPQP